MSGRIAHIAQQKSGRVSAVSLTVTLDNPVTAGNKLIAAVTRNSGTAGITWPAGWTNTVGTTGSGHEGYIRYKDSDGTETGLTISDSGSVSRIFEIYLYEVANLVPGNTTNTGTAGSSGSGVTSKATGTSSSAGAVGDFAIAQVSMSTAVTPVSFSNSYNLFTPVTTPRSMVGHLILTSAATQTTTATWTTSAVASGRIAVFSATQSIPRRENYQAVKRVGFY